MCSSVALGQICPRIPVLGPRARTRLADLKLFNVLFDCIVLLDHPFNASPETTQLQIAVGLSVS